MRPARSIFSTVSWHRSGRCQAGDRLRRGITSERPGVTVGDLAYLRVLYSADLETPVALERSNIGVMMLRAFADRR